MKFFKTAIALLILGWTFPLQAVTPMEYYNSLVAGDDDAGFRDGAFDDARFNRPCGLAFDETGSRLFVADQNNNRIRVVYLDEDNRVETAAGTGAASSLDGNLNQATFDGPSVIAYLPGDRLAVYENGSQNVRIVDLKNNKVSILKSAIGIVWNMVYRPREDCLYLSEPLTGSLQMLDLKTANATMLLLNNSQVPQPQALCSYQDQLYLSDGNTSMIYQVEPVFNTLSAVVSIGLKVVGHGNEVMEMTGSDGALYALQGGEVALATVWPQYRPVSLISSWGFTLENTNPGYEPFLNLQGKNEPIGFAASPRESRKFYVAGQNADVQNILSFKDYHFDKTWFARREQDTKNVLSDFDYPTDKPKKTFRILIIGSSRVITAPTVFPGEQLIDSELDQDDQDAHSLKILNDQDFHSLKTNTFPKQLELMLNANAALKGNSEHFEVLTLGHPGMSIQFFYKNEIVGMAKKYHVDLVLGLVTPSGEEKFENYYTRPLDADGIPSEDLDSEYLFKPWKERIPSGAPTRLYASCLKRNLVSEALPNQLQFPLFQDLLLTGDQEIRDNLIEMIGKPLKVTAQKLEAFQNPDGQVPRFCLCFVPDQDVPSAGVYESFWLDLAARNKFKMLDLMKPYEDLKTSFYPTSEACCHHHYTAYGNGLIAYLLSYYLPQQKWIPDSQ